ncbi:FtsW/RodA/SpoVE family cell cycle protein [Cellulomonas cellasea]|uniref:Cell division protein FtsW (Lipid II flippase) n=1 Tax=Cellulomonas cellasea TaxID=43670 RepID=A0A7W4UJ86_9CELL|nr:FtsW/RodA/SpoVE family cell cycle protein [Cellulomonas cellasea]MBB2925191.1 cell division protein FtsW (lipid II flippase) [Cellulomonas cellasea]
MATIQPHRVRPGRGVELALLVPALLIGLAAYALTGLGVTGELPGNVVGYGVGMAALALGLHVVLRWRAPYADPVILPVAIALNGIGLAMIYRIDLGMVARGREQDFATRQLGWTTFALLLAAGVLVVLRDHRTLRRYTYTAMVVGLLLIVLPLVPGLGVEINGARIWIRLGGFSLQPAEIGKLVLAVFFAGYLVTNRDTLALAGPKILGLQLPRIRDLGPLVLAWAVSISVLVLERDLGTSLLFFGLFVAMLYLATERTSWVVIGLGLFLGGAVLAATTFGHVAARFDVWLNALDPEIYNRAPGGSGQLVGGLFGLAGGGLFGTGWGKGRPDLVPYAESDFIVASLGEELGLTGLLGILLCYLVLAERGMRTAIGVRDGFGKLLAGGLAFVVAFQCFIVVGGITRIIPLTGLTTPFLAYGGSSLLANWIIVALLLRISDDARRPAPDLVTGPPPGTTTAPLPVRTPGSSRAGAPRREGEPEPSADPTERIAGPGGVR